MSQLDLIANQSSSSLDFVDAWSRLGYRCVSDSDFVIKLTAGLSGTSNLTSTRSYLKMIGKNIRSEDDR